ncbi:hypothetical protein QPK31_16480 [Massilia sp. YIM B02769]|uniref:hypothetical protein n=1 Tax=Massilia sp. YIM B02769 TaxID=3050129 RepID=UPI0025B702DC|nr:hypothetical protein [Massilia sp. YIM B02769]MDN4059823.1 hypothetical protein [Massilia sp. YIM B02769]
MQATLFISAEAMTTVNAIKDLDYYSRVSLSDEPETDLTTAPGYFINTNALHIAELPAGAEVAIHLTPVDQATYRQHVSMPANLRGVIFSGAPNLPPDYAEVISYWSPLVPTMHHRSAVYFQNEMNSYCVHLVDPDDAGETCVVGDADHAGDFLISDGLVVTITGLAAMVADLKPDLFVSLSIPINLSMLGIELEGYRSTDGYATDPAPQIETLYLRIADILASPDPKHIAISAIRTELSDYGYTY